MGAVMFVGRINELVSIRNALLTPGSAVMIYGKRKVGKTTLIKEALQKRKKHQCLL